VPSYKPTQPIVSTAGTTYGPGDIVITSATDPGAAGPGKVWVNIAVPGTPTIFVRNAANSAWVQVTAAPGATPTLAAVLTAGNSATAQLIQHLSGVFLDSINGAATGIGVIVVQSDPSAGAGVPATVGDLALAADGTLWQKTGALDTQWSQIASAATPTLAAVLGVSAGENDADAITGANAPTAANPFATIADIPTVPTIAHNVVATNESLTGNNAWVDLTTPGPAVTATVLASGKARVTLTCRITESVTDGYAGMGVDLSGANTVAAADTRCLLLGGAGYSSDSMLSAVFLLTGLGPGATTFTAKYKQFGAPGTDHFINREIIVECF
jgi:hypothetical protein